MNDFFNLLTHDWIERNAPTLDLTKLKSTQNSLIFLLKGTITDKSQMDYQLVKDGKVYISWRKNDFDNNFIWLKNLPHGKYQLRVRYNAQPEHIGTCNFIIKPPWYQTMVIKLISGSLLTVFLGLIAMVSVLLAQRRKAAIEAEKQKRLQTELQVIRSQLNPHFIFNALSSIQSLVNKQDNIGANNYLTEFSELLRNTLNNAELEQLPLEKEIKILETYLKLEKLRFNFNYQIEVESDINRYETKIPSLLLQPLLENAVKHGISNLKDTGKLLLRFDRKGLDLIATVSDNGKGFDANTVTAGYGLKLVRKRIELLNDVFKNKIVLSIYSDKNSLTEIAVTFINWFA
jgi:two-component sensor histidine kinase